MKRPPRPEPKDRDGYVSLLAMSFALGLAILGGALSVGLRHYMTSAAQQERRIRDTVLFESAAADLLGRLAAGAEIDAAQTEPGRLTGSVTLVTVPAAKVDLRADSPEAIEETAREIGIPVNPATARQASGLAELSGRLRLTASQEDCLRSAFTYGRGGAPRIAPEAIPQKIVVRAGDQVDLRVTAGNEDGPVLWLRVRFTGGETGWAVHDYRWLSEPCSPSRH